MSLKVYLKDNLIGPIFRVTQAAVTGTAGTVAAETGALMSLAAGVAPQLNSELAVVQTQTQGLVGALTVGGRVMWVSLRTLQNDPSNLIAYGLVACPVVVAGLTAYALNQLYRGNGGNISGGTVAATFDNPLRRAASQQHKLDLKF